jgi:hypothetical protein
VDVTNEHYKKLDNCPLGYAWKWNEQIKQFELAVSPYHNCLRHARSTICFPIINRGVGWYMSLTAEQQSELQQWYQAWLNVTETEEIPTMPSWLH